MRKRVFGRQLRRTKNQRKALFRSLMRALVLDERIQTTEAKAKSIKGEIEKFVTKAIRKGEDARYHLSKHFPPNIVNKLITDIAPRFSERNGGYTRILHMGPRVKDSAEMVLLEWVDVRSVPVVTKKDARAAVKEEAKKKTAITKTEKVEVKAEVKKEKVAKGKNEKHNKTNKK